MSLSNSNSESLASSTFPYLPINFNLLNSCIDCNVYAIMNYWISEYSTTNMKMNAQPLPTHFDNWSFVSHHFGEWFPVLDNHKLHHRFPYFWQKSSTYFVKFWYEICQFWKLCLWFIKVVFWIWIFFFEPRLYHGRLFIYFSMVKQLDFVFLPIKHKTITFFFLKYYFAVRGKLKIQMKLNQVGKLLFYVPRVRV